MPPLVRGGGTACRDGEVCFMKCCTKKNMNRLRIGGIDNILAYIVVSIPLIYLLIMMIGTLYHYAVQSYIAQAVEDTVNNASAYGTLTTAMINELDSKLRITGGSVKYTLVRKRYNRDTDDYTDRSLVDGTVSQLRGRASTTELIDGTTKRSTYFRKGDIIALQITSRNESLLSTISKFSLFGSGGGSNMYYTAYKEDIIRNVGADEI